jgi:N-acetylmuramoyl-L-alanine amidase
MGLSWLAWMGATLDGQGPVLTLLSRDGRRTLPLTVAGEQEFVALDELAATFQLAVREESGAVTVSYKGRTIVLNPEQAIASVAGRVISLSARPTRSGGRLLVPVDFISRAIAPIYDSRVDFRRSARLLIVGDLRVPRVTIAAEPSSTSLRLTIDASPRTTSVLTREADHLTLRFDADALDLNVPTLPPQPYAQAIRRGDPVTLTVDLGPRFGSYRSSMQDVDDSTRVTLDLVSATTDTAAGPAPPATPGTPSTPSTPSPGDIPASPELSPLRQPRTPIQTIVIDPGHGGTDEGAKGATGPVEKTMTLTAARRLKAALEARLGVRVLLTRDADRDVPFDTRTAVANNNKADLFISLHANASFRPSAAGASVLVASFADEAGARQALAPHRVPVFGGGVRDIELLPWNQAQIRYLDRSIAFARMLEEQFQGRVPIDTNPTDRAPLRVLASANMPAVVIEMGYLSNPEQAQQLESGEFQGALSQAVVEAVVAFRNLLEDPRRLDAPPGLAR